MFAVRSISKELMKVEPNSSTGIKRNYMYDFYLQINVKQVGNNGTATDKPTASVFFRMSHRDENDLVLTIKQQRANIDRIQSKIL